MKRRKWKMVALLIACVMAMTACGKSESGNQESAGTQESGNQESTGKQEEKSYVNATGFPIVNEEITLKVLCYDNGLRTVDYADMEGWKYLSELTGIKFEFEYYNSEDIYTVMPLIMSNPDDMPDLFIQCGMSGDDLLSYGQQGMLMDMTDLVEKYGDNIKKNWETVPLNKSYATASDGKIYGLPAYNDKGTGLDGTFRLIRVNTRWMENCGITEYPTTVEEFKEMLIKFRDMDANGNGNPNDEIPMEGNQNHLYQMLAAAYDFPLDWPYVDAQYGALYGTTEAVPVFMLDNYRAMVEYLNELYEEDLINQDMFSVSKEERNARRLSDLVGVVTSEYGNTEEKYNPDEWVCIPPLSSEYNEDPSAYIYLTPSYQTGMAMISSYTKYPEACIRVIDYMMGVDGTVLFDCISTEKYDLEAMGVSKEVINLTKAAIERYGDTSTGHANLTGCSTCRWSLPFADYQDLTFNNKMEQTQYEVKNAYTGKVFYNPTHTISFTAEELEIVSTYKTDISGYVTETVAKWVIGEEKLNDATWNAYIEQLKKMNVDKLTEANVSAHKRFYGVN